MIKTLKQNFFCNSEYERNKRLNNWLYCFKMYIFGIPKLFSLQSIKDVLQASGK